MYDPRAFQIDGAIALITGAGIGRAIAVLLCALATGVGWAQEAMAEEPAVGSDARDRSLAYPAGLEAPSIALDELQLRLVPLTAEQIAPLAAAWQDQARTATQAVVDKSLEIRAADEPETEALRQERLELVEERERVFDKFAAVISSLEAKGGDPADVEAMRGYVSAVTSAARSQLTLQEFADSFLDWLISPDGGVRLAIQAAVIIAAWFGLLIVARIVRAWVRRAVDRTPSLNDQAHRRQWSAAELPSGAVSCSALISSSVDHIEEFWCVLEYRGDMSPRLKLKGRKTHLEISSNSQDLFVPSIRLSILE
ncbi:MAG: hypothetical protein VBE63_24975 [Lamprobacter sp.]|uniref:hypothetical protein n=1 Tax=Lamprobacter sp. TaxID=3100796 RepID=UPI002B2607E6|nr:hypothetical protein [Lamprobacter sp.]MEA3643166.1 hypothetical protein [Lamprobacter sp.]